MSGKDIRLIIGIIVFGALMRFMPHAPNFTPITAMAIFAGSMLPSRSLAVLALLGAMLLSDIVLGFHSTMLAVYPALVLIIFIAQRFSGKLSSEKSSVVFSGKLLGVTLASSTLFFVVTNFAVWALQSLYPKTLTGLVACYVAALPFFQNSLLSDLFFTAVLFGMYFVADNILSRKVNVANLR